MVYSNKPVVNQEAISDAMVVVIRSVGERTEGLCKKLVIEQGVPPSNIFFVRETPFSKTLSLSFEVGIREGRPWTFCVDADVLLRPGAIMHMLSLAVGQKGNVFEIQGGILDKFFGGSRAGGVHLYRTNLLDRGLSLIPVEGTNIRPESHMLNSMKAAGFPWRQFPYVVGLHDFEQFSRDIFRKCFVHGFKHQRFANLFTEVWREGARTDPDYEIALTGFAKGLEYYGGVRIDARADYIKDAFATLKVGEKEDLDLEKWSLGEIENVLTSWVEHDAFRVEHTSWVGFHKLGATYLTPRQARLRIIMRQYGPLKGALFLLGYCFRIAGMRLQRLVR